jgi:transposase
MPFERKDIQDLLALKIKLKEQCEISPAVELLINSLFSIVSYQFDQIEGLKEENALLRAEINELKKSGKKNSKNSSTPPAMDPNRKRGRSRKTGKSPGGQVGHKGFTLKKVEAPDDILNYKLKGRCRCGLALSNIKKRGFEERQVFDIEIRRNITSHRAELGVCRCGEKHRANFPKEVNAHVQYGESAKSLAAYFCQYQLIPFERTQEIFNDIFNLGLCKGTVFNHIVKGSESLIDFKDWVSEALLKSKINHADETGIQVNKERYHLHVLSNEKTTLIEAHKGRGKEAVEAMGIIPQFKGKLVHDCYAMYFGYPCKDVICNAHLIRELEYFC